MNRYCFMSYKRSMKQRQELKRVDMPLWLVALVLLLLLWLALPSALLYKHKLELRAKNQFAATETKRGSDGRVE